MSFACMSLSKRWFVNYCSIWLSSIFPDKAKKILGLLLLPLMLFFNISAVANNLFFAVKTHNIETIYQLIREKWNVNIQDNNGNTPLHEAIYHDFPEGARVLINSGSNTNITNKHCMTAFHVAALKGNVKILNLLIPVVGNINVRDSEGNTALHLAASQGHEQCVRLLVNYKKNIDLLSNAITDKTVYLKHRDFDISSSNNFGNTPLHLTARERHSNCFFWLLTARGIKVNVKHGDWYNVLQSAIEVGDVSYNELLLTDDSEQTQNLEKLDQTIFYKAVFAKRRDNFSLLINSIDYIPVNTQNTNLHTALWYAAINGLEECIDLLLKVRNIDVNISDNQGNSPLFMAAVNGHETCVKKLVEHGADANTKNVYKNTPLQSACAKGFTEIFIFLLNHTSHENIRAKNSHGDTILHEAAFSGRAECLAALLPYLTADDINIKDSFGRTALHKSAWKGHTKCIEILLLSNLAIPNTFDYVKQNEIYAAVDNNHSECIPILAKAGVDVNAKNEQGYTALHAAAAKGYAQCTRELIKIMNPESINAKNKLMYTALNRAVEKEQTECLEILLQSPHIDINAVDGYGKTALHVAVIRQNREYVKMLIKAGAGVCNTNTFQPTVLHTASDINPEYIELLLENINVAHINIPDTYGNTVLHKAAFRGDLNSVKKLINAGADIDVRNNHGAKVFHCAASNGHGGVVEYLLSIQKR